MSASEPANRKRELRERYRRARQQADPKIRAQHDRLIRQQLLDHLVDQPKVTVGAFLSFDGEPAIEPALLELRGLGARIALPVLDHSSTFSMTMRNWDRNTALVANRYGIPEPLDGERVQLASIDILLMPLVAYDRQGVRLGLGGGYYDRLLADAVDGLGPLRVGVAYAQQEVPKIPSEPWDIPLDALLNEHGWFSFPL